MGYARSAASDARQVAEPVRWQVRGRPQEPLPGGDGVGDQGEDFRADRDRLWSVGVPLDPVQQRRLADPRDRCGFGGAPPRLAAHLVLKERADPQPCALAAERDRRSDKALAVNTAAGIQDSAQAARGLFEQARLPLLEVADPGRQPPGSGLMSDDHFPRLPVELQKLKTFQCTLDPGQDLEVRKSRHSHPSGLGLRLSSSGWQGRDSPCFRGLRGTRKAGRMWCLGQVAAGAARSRYHGPGDLGGLPLV